MTLADSLFALWLTLTPSTPTPLPSDWIPLEAGSVQVVKGTGDLRYDDGSPITAKASRIWDPEAGPSECVILINPSQIPQTIQVMIDEIDVKDVELFNLTHELGHCADRRRKPLDQSDVQTQKSLHHREVFASSFGACLMQKMDKADAAKRIASSFKTRIKGSFGLDQSTAIRSALDHPACQASGGSKGSTEKKDFEDAWKAASDVDQQMFGSASLEVPFEHFMKLRSEAAH